MPQQSNVLPRLPNPLKLNEMNTQSTTVFYNGRTYTYAQAEQQLREWLSIKTWGMSQSFRDWHSKATRELAAAMRKATGDNL